MEPQPPVGLQRVGSLWVMGVMGVMGGGGAHSKNRTREDGNSPDFVELPDGDPELILGATGLDILLEHKRLPDHALEKVLLEDVSACLVEITGCAAEVYVDDVVTRL
jgi:hypothetical protein